jgi:hypothetical protein
MIHYLRFAIHNPLAPLSQLCFIDMSTENEAHRGLKVRMLFEKRLVKNRLTLEHGYIEFAA